MALVSFQVVREGREWYVDDPGNGFSHEDNLLVSGIPEILEALAGPGAFRLRVTASDAPFPGCIELRLVDGDCMGGVSYEATIGGLRREGWLCQVFWHYFPVAPARLHAAVEVLERA